MNEAKHHGVVREYDAERGYGVIVDQQAQEYFVHFRELVAVPALSAGQQVCFEAVLHRKGNIANQVEVI